MIPSANTDHHIRRFPLGVVVCLATTLLVLVAAGMQQPPIAASIDYDLAARTVITNVAPAIEKDGQNAGLKDSASAVRELLRLFAASGDGRYLRYASALLAAFSRYEAEGGEHRLLRARVLQSQHRFVAAADLLRILLKTEPGNTEAWLLLSDASRRAGNIVDARRACMNLALIGQATLAKWCAVQVLQSTGDTRRAYQVATGLVDRMSKYPLPQRRWSLEITAETAFVAGREQEATAYYERALALGESTMALRLAFADTLLRLNRHYDVIDLLQDDRRKVGALIRIAIAEQGLGEPANPVVELQIDESFAGLTPASSTDVRLRDRAIYELYYRMNAKAALEYALANWRQQKGSEDFTLLYDSADLAREPEVVRMLERWQAQATGNLQS